jgi:hypothetical protein
MYRLPFILALSAIAAGCAPMSTTTSFPDQGISIQQSNFDRVTFYDVRHKTNATGQSIIVGLLKRTDTRHLHSGHIDFQLIDKSGQVLETGTVKYSSGIKDILPTNPSLRNRLKKRSSHFEISLKHRWQPDQYELHLNWDGASHSAQP